MTGIQLAARIALITTFVAVAFLCSRAEAASGSPVGVVVSCARNDLVLCPINNFTESLKFSED
jgi:hypothetical protein